MRLKYALLLNILEPMLVISGDNGLMRIDFLSEAYEYKPQAYAYARSLGKATGQDISLAEDTASFRNLRVQLAEYFTGTRQRFDIPVDLRGSEFQLAVWKRLLAIPYAKLRTYKQVAAEINRPTATRAVGQAAGQNPIPIIVPCHRVVGAGGELVGFAGGMSVKAQLLRLEGHTLEGSERIVAPRLF